MRPEICVDFDLIESDLNKKIHYAESAFPPIRVNRYAHDDAAEMVSTQKLTARPKPLLPKILTIDAFRLPLIIYQVCPQAEKSVANHQSRAAFPGLTKGQFFFCFLNLNDIVQLSFTP